MKRLYIVGAGGFGREVFGWLQDCAPLRDNYAFAGFLDDNPSALDGFDLPLGVVASCSGFEPDVEMVFLCGIGQVEAKRRVCGDLIARGARFLQLIHPSAIIGRNVALGEGVVICPRVTLTCDIEVGEMTMINVHSSAGHDVRIGSWATISAHCDLTGFTRIGSGAFLGSRVSIIPGKVVGKNAVVGAGSLVLRDVAPDTRVFGNPARAF